MWKKQQYGYYYYHTNTVILIKIIMISSDTMMHGGHRAGRELPMLCTTFPVRSSSPGRYNHMSHMLNMLYGS